jgi:hypothetical protein
MGMRAFYRFAACARALAALLTASSGRPVCSHRVEIEGDALAVHQIAGERHALIVGYQVGQRGEGTDAHNARRILFHPCWVHRRPLSSATDRRCPHAAGR